MELFSAIYSRHSQGKVRPDPLPREIIEQLLAAAVQAPNHYKVRPWRFVVMTGKGREVLGESMLASFKAKFPDVAPDAYEKERLKPLRAPVVIAAAVDQPAEPKVNEIENIAATAAACQNLLLAANALGLAGIWRTGDAARDPEIKKALGLSPEQHLIGFLYIGYPEITEITAAERPSFEDRTVWLE